MPSRVCFNEAGIPSAKIHVHVEFYSPTLMPIPCQLTCAQSEDSQRAAHEKMLVKAFLQRKLSHAFSSEELARLKQKGIYKKAEHEKLEAERLLVTRQVRWRGCLRKK